MMVTVSKLVLVLLAIASHHTAVAQSVRLAVPPDSLVPRPAFADTVAALHRLFAAQRRKRSYVVGATAVVVGVGLIPDSSPKTIVSQRVVAAVLGIPALVTELLYYNAYNRRREQRAIDAFQAHKLSRSLQQRLKPTYFR